MTVFLVQRKAILMRKLVISYLVVGMMNSAVEAQLFMTVNTVDHTYTITGQDTGELVGPFSTGDSIVSWGTGSTGGGHVNFFGGVASSGTLDHFGLFIHGDGGITIQAADASSGTITLTGLGQPVSYFFPPDLAGGIFDKASLESLIGSSLPLKTGTGWSDIQISAVPEPSSYLAMASVGLLVFSGMHRRRARERRESVSV